MLNRQPGRERGRAAGTNNIEWQVSEIALLPFQQLEADIDDVIDFLMDCRAKFSNRRSATGCPQKSG